MNGNDPIATLCSLFARLPSVGERTAARLAYYVLGADPSYAKTLGHALIELHERIRPCERCGNYTAEALCNLCRNPKRDASLLCVVARPPDIGALERGNAFHGRYFVLHNLLSPLDGIGPDALPSEELLALVQREAIKEVIIATPLSVEGEATALYLAQLLREQGVLCSRIASGLPHGGELEYSDQVTLSRALEGRREL